MNSRPTSRLALSLLYALLCCVLSCSQGGMARSDFPGGDTDTKDTTGQTDGQQSDVTNDQTVGGKDNIFADQHLDNHMEDVELVLDPCLLDPGAFSCPCKANSDCLGGYCIESTLGAACSQECIEECPMDWICTGMTGFGSDLVFLCVPPHKDLCMPCEKDSDCTGEKCLMLDGEKECVYACTADSECPQGFQCKPTDLQGTMYHFCIPESNSCSCLLEDNQKVRPCIRENDFGVCSGFQLCDSKLGWGECSAEEATEEVCDGSDNDCDGQYDEGLPELKPCEVTVPDVGTCKGNASCGGISGWVCPAQTPIEEICDHLDNDCDGVVDNGFQVGGKYVHAQHCGGCGTSCEFAVAHGTAYCNSQLTTPQCNVLYCEDNYYKANIFQCLPIGQTQCKPCFNDSQCEGGTCTTLAGASICLQPCTETDDCPAYAVCQEVEGKEGTYCMPLSADCLCTGDSAGLEKPCSVTMVDGTCYGKQVCDPEEGWGACSAAMAAPEECDGLDNDCDGIPDDGLPVGEACEVTVPDVGTCTGIRVCMGEQGWKCSATIPTEEVCDYQDNNCNGEVDEVFKEGDVYFTDEHCGGCGKSCVGALPNAVAYCDTSDTAPVCKVNECVPGYYRLNDFQCIAPPDVQCSECTDSSQCYLLTCAQVEQSMHCLQACVQDSDCGEDYQCLDAPEGGKLCYPLTGSCRCTPENTGLQWACQRENEWGTCFGIKICEAFSGWSPCSAKEPSEEVCNGQNDDCDGLVDEGLPETIPCDNRNDWGICEGQAVCMGTPGWVCVASTPAAESCDYLDNDCDGMVDEEFTTDGKYTTNEHCGTCNNGCEHSIANATGTCDATYTVPKCIVQSCNEGYVQISPFQCILPPDTTCQACQVDKDCLGSLCVVVDGEKRCAASCAGPGFGECESGYLCQELPGFNSVCLPVTGSCACSPQTIGIKRTCSQTNELGTCYGVETCLEEGWSNCTALLPAAEICNGKDDDCNGLADEGLPDYIPCQQTNIYGTCLGQAACAGTLGWVCQAQTPKPEVCDFIDNDCDSQVDETFKTNNKYTTNEHCGACNNSCDGAIPNATAVCDASFPTPKCVVSQCDEGYFQISPFQCIVPPDSTCYDCIEDTDCQGGHCMTIDGEKRCVVHCETQADCAGETECQDHVGAGMICYPTSGSCTCNSYTDGVKRTCSNSSQFGLCYGFETCSATTGWSPCDAQVASPEVCNGADDNCNGLVDDGLPATMDCTKQNAWGTCSGLSICLGPLGWVCQAQLPAEDLCDYVDNDCDGAVDEAFKSGTKYVTQENCGACNNSCEGAIPNATATCDASYPTPKCVVESCDEGYFQVSPFQCIIPPDSTCLHCQLDSDCLGGRCLEIDGETRCVVSCTEQADCLGETTCEEITGAGTVCYPTTGSCTCNTYNDSAKRTCTHVSRVGTCYGYETCNASLGWSTCDAPIAVQEICNGVDDDCNGLVDDGLPETMDCFKENAWGKCTGLSVCLGTLGWVCQAGVPAQEVCDYADNDCDGVVDDGFKVGTKYTTLEHCGACNNSCVGAIPNATALCDSTYPTPKCVVDTCNDGYYKISPFQCIIPPDSTCYFCQTDVDCVGGHCLTIDGEQRCVVSCETQTDCLGETTCEEIAGHGKVCYPITDSCTCNSDVAGAKRTCSTTSPVGTCYGNETCNATTGWSSCDAPTAVLEVCNGVDDDCNGAVDDGLPATMDCQKSNSWGTCLGKSVCLGPLGWVCQANVPAQDLCDYLDNDCDGSVDETYKSGSKYVDLYNCGACNNSCVGAIQNATAFCDSSYPTPRCAVESCDEGYFQVSPFQCIIPPDSTCFTCNTDADCMGGSCILLDGEKRCVVACDEQADCVSETTCESIGSSLACVPNTGSCTCNSYTQGFKRSCSKTNPIGTCFGFETCDSLLGWSTCDALVPSGEVCNGVDDDCNGSVDEGLPETQDCSKTNVYGTCTGVAICQATLGWVCQANTPAAEVCDYQDNDCDGLVDDGFKVGTKYITDEHCGSCNNPCLEAIPNATGKCDPTPTVPRCIVDTCDPGYYKLSPYQCVIPPDTSCQPCTTTDSCYGSPCITIDGQNRCAATCLTNTDCASGYECLTYGALGTLCQPITGSCECSALTAGNRRSCEITNAYGTCLGFEQCDPEEGWTACDALVPAAESCDGKDNDCDGSIDEGLPATIPCSTTNEYGSCDGQATCGGTLGWLCNAQVPAMEMCDYLDNNCNGMIDEDFMNAGGIYNNYFHCGDCNQSCKNSVLNGTAKCDVEGTTASCVVDTCNIGYFIFEQVQCLPDTAALCETCVTSADCASAEFMCVTYNLEKFCSRECSTEVCPTGYNCLNVSGAMRCIPVSGSCNCDGSDTSLSRACTATWPPAVPEAEADAVCLGVQPCTTTGWGDCILPLETCDGLDNDCDGATDEDFMSGGQYVSDEHCGQCGNDCTNLPYDNVVGFCDELAMPPTCDVACIPGYFNPNGHLSDGCECFYVGELDIPDGVDQNCDGIDGEIDNGLFVATWGDDSNPGTIDEPLATIHFALLASGTSGKRDVYVAGGYYPGSVVVVPGVKIYGGYSDDFTIRDSIVYQSTVEGDVPTTDLPAPLTAIGIVGLAGTTIVDGFYFMAANAVAPGTSSYASYVKNCNSALVLRRNHFVAGSGAPGSPGEPGSNGTMGVAGNPGLAAVATTSNICDWGLVIGGGNGATGSCGSVSTAGGKGGDSYCPTYEGGPEIPENGLPGSGTAPGAGGLAGWDGKIHHASCKMCTFPNDQIVEGEDGLDGAPGTNGLPGMGCSTVIGSNNGLFWLPAKGNNAGGGLPGSGGGGGGSGGGGDSDTSKCMDVVGGTGGGGGSGGCPGTGGYAGYGGGGSFSLFVVFTSAPASIPTVESNIMIAGYGGAGGQGGTGGSGGAGGAGAPGGAAGASDVYCTFGGGAGGYGGTGGHGGGGGGGCGGVSYCEYAITTGGTNLSTYKTANTCIFGAPGAGGLGGVSFGVVGQNGQPGAWGLSNF